MPDDRFTAAIALIDAANAQDPHGRELLYSRRMTETLNAFEPNAPELVRIAARAQHIRRWEVPRSTYPPDRIGYLKWRTDMGAFHADVTEQILRQVGYDEQSIARVRGLLTKKQIKIDPWMQLLEDVICLVFLQHYFDEFVAENPGQGDAKLVNILQRTWKKMSDRGHDAALQLPFSAETHRLLNLALVD